MQHHAMLSNQNSRRGGGKGKNSYGTCRPKQPLAFKGPDFQEAAKHLAAAEREVANKFLLCFACMHTFGSPTKLFLP